MNRAVEAAVFENGSDTILGEGLAYDRCQVGVITNVEAARHFGRYYIETPEQVYNVLRTQVDLVLPTGAAVLNAGQPMLVEMAPLCDGEVIFFAADPDLPAIVEHRAQGKRAVFVRNGQVVLASGEDETAIVSLKGIPLTDGGGQLDFQVENVLAATGCGLGARHRPRTHPHRPGNLHRRLIRKPPAGIRRARPPASALNQKEETVHGSLAYPRSARSQSLEPAYGD